MANESILALDCGGGDAMQVARAIRGIGVYCEIVDTRSGFDSVSGRDPAGMLLLGGSGGAPEVPAELLSQGIPILAMGAMAHALLAASGGTIGEPMIENQIADVRFEGNSPLFDGMEGSIHRIDQARTLSLPEGFLSYATGDGATLAFGDEKRRLYGLQFPLERNDMDGYRVLTNFVRNICQCTGNWSLESYLDQAVSGLRNRAKDGIAICPMTGGVDTAACAALTYRALGDRARCVLIDTGLMTLGEAEGVERAFNEEMNVPIVRIVAGERFLHALRGVSDSAQKERIVAEQFSALLHEQEPELAQGHIFLIRGTIYDDVLGNAADDAAMTAPGHWIAMEPLRGLFKHEVRELGGMLGLPDSIVKRQPFPGAGLAVRCMGEITPERIHTLRAADAVFKRTLEEASANRGLQMYFAALADLSTLDCAGSREGETVLLRAVQQRDTGSMFPPRMSFDVLEQATDAILREAPGVTRVLYDLTPRPPAAVEYE